MTETQIERARAELSTLPVADSDGNDMPKIGEAADREAGIREANQECMTRWRLPSRSSRSSCRRQRKKQLPKLRGRIRQDPQMLHSGMGTRASKSGGTMETSADLAGEK